MKTSDWLAGRSYPSWNAIRANGNARRRGFERGPGSAGGARATRDWVCEHCGRGFRAKPVHDRRGAGTPRRFCTVRCSTAGLKAESLARRQVRLDGLLEILDLQPRRAGGPPTDRLDPSQAAELAAKALVLIRLQMPLAHEAVMGQRDWSTSQARVFSELLDRALPDLRP